MSERHSATSEIEQQLVFDLMREKLQHLFGAGGSFTISVGRATAEDAVFVDTVISTVAHQVATAFNPARQTPGRRAASPQEQHDEIWSAIEAEMEIRRSGADGFLGDLEAGITPEPAAPLVEAGAEPEVEHRTAA